MIEGFKVATDAAVEVTKEVAKEAAKEAAKETGKAIASETGKEVAKESVDISKRLDISKEITNSKGNRIDITKRLTPDKTNIVNDKVKELNTKQIKELTDKGMSPGIVNDCKFEDGVYKLKTKNDKLADTVHPESGVSYQKKIVDLFGTKIEGVFPKFDSVFTTELPKDKLMASDKTQFDYCTNQLKNELKSNPSLREKFSPRQLEQIENGKTPGGYTWHHNEEVGKMELVDSDKHELTKHVGGKAIWGGGKSFR